MKPLTFLIIAGDPSGDLAAADLVRALRNRFGPFPPRFIGAGGPALRSAGVELDYELTGHSVIGLEILKRLAFFRRVFAGLLRLADTETPDVVIGVDYAGFNLRFAETLRKRLRRRSGPFQNWRPRVIQYISPQVWASRPGRAQRLARTHDLLLSILPFESSWFAQRVPQLRVEFVGHPLVDRHLQSRPPSSQDPATGPCLVLLPGSRISELIRHLPVVAAAAAQVRRETGIRLLLVLPEERLRPITESLLASYPEIEIQIGQLSAALLSATVAMASTGTVTLECAWFGVPTVALYKTWFLTYQVGKRIITVPHLAMPNLLAGETVLPEFVQDDATASNLASATLALLRDNSGRLAIRRRLLELAQSLGQPGTSQRAADAIARILNQPGRGT